MWGGTWQAVTDKFILAAGSQFLVGGTGGEVTHTLTVDEMPSHQHDKLIITMDKDYEITYSNTLYPGDGMSAAIGVNGNPSMHTSITGGGQPHNNMPPYVVAYCWQRTA